MTFFVCWFGHIITCHTCRRHHAEDEETFLLHRALLVTDLSRDEPHQKGQQQRHQTEERSEGKTQQNHTEVSQ